ncbi:DUF2231 domain-containing protein [Pyxidicoccus fallax]|uniref:DUF2231 domain-containing protein n=1 Tax=Pyxidicoccus fallax TaxID=394095 RepID=A0A848LEE8_9BACT|nr:DUF2231 domain-containing protein [Pyxidicoccus fallax]NMO16764.1 DUF2231 domain-containing protein [Pyxidicoccus fallax]NPC77843.1 DUF2231 domain-containing protein [Pyxidicoccus fallax]
MKREMLLHELHPSVVHAPLALLPTAAVADCISVVSGDRAWGKVARRLWVAGTLSGLFAGVAGLAASQEVRMDSPRARDMTFLHGVGNSIIMLGAMGVTAWRLRREPTLTTALLGLGACGLALYTASLGGKMVYELGVGINPMPEDAAQGTLKGPPLLSTRAPVALVTDALQGVKWLISRARELLTGERPLAPGAEGLRSPEDATLPLPLGMSPVPGHTMPQA